MTDTNPITAADKYPGCAARLRKAGYPNVARMAETFASAADIDRALGVSGSASHWLAGRNNVSRAMEQAAGMWLALNDRPEEKVKDAPKGTPEDFGPVVFAVYCPPDKADKLAKVVAMFGCEAVEI